MAGNSSLGDAKRNKNDEFYTKYQDIESEMNAYYEFNHDVFRGKTILCPCDDPEWSNFTKYFAANFERFGLKKLICTSYAKSAGNRQLSLFEGNSPLYDADKHETHGKLFTLTRDTDGSGIIDNDDVEFNGYLEGDGDFRSAEVTKLRDEADIIITNPAFSLFREFLKWIMDGRKQFAIIGNMNAITYKEVFPKLKNNEMWLGASIHSGDRAFNVPDDYPLDAAGCGIDDNGHKYIRVKGVRWFANIDFAKRHQPMQLDTMAHNLKYNKKLRKKLITTFSQDESDLYYPHYDNYAAIEVPFSECIPSDYDGVMGVPISWLDKHAVNDGFEIVNANDYRKYPSVPIKASGLVKDKEASITLSNSRERESHNICTNPHQENCLHQELTDGISMADVCMPVSLLRSYDDMVARPVIGHIKTYRRIFIRKDKRN